MNDVIGTTNDIQGFFVSYDDEIEGKIAVINADKNTPDDIFQMAINEIIRAGYFKRNIYRTAIDRNKLTLGLVRIK